VCLTLKSAMSHSAARVFIQLMGVCLTLKSAMSHSAARVVAQ